MFYKNGKEFEKAVFNRSGSKKRFLEFYDQKSSFSKEIETIILKSDVLFPNTNIGTALYKQVVRELGQQGIDPRNLLFLPSVDTKADYHHNTDGVLYVPSLHPNFVTLDLFNIDPAVLLNLREKWIDTFEGKVYTESHFQSDLFHQKSGASEWRKLANRPDGIIPWEYVDFRKYDSFRRPENHFILTPLHTGTYEKRREFAQMIAGYFKKVSGTKKQYSKP